MSITVPFAHDICLVFRGHPNVLSFTAATTELILVMEGWFGLFVGVLVLHAAAEMHVVREVYQGVVLAAERRRRILRRRHHHRRRRSS
jgi:hypothetical protein